MPPRPMVDGPRAPTPTRWSPRPPPDRLDGRGRLAVAADRGLHSVPACPARVGALASPQLSHPRVKTRAQDPSSRALIRDVTSRHGPPLPSIGRFTRLERVGAAEEAT